MLELCLPCSETLVKTSQLSHLTRQISAASFYINYILLFEHLSAFKLAHKDVDVHPTVSHIHPYSPLHVCSLFLPRSVWHVVSCLFPVDQRLNVQQLPAVGGLAH